MLVTQEYKNVIKPVEFIYTCKLAQIQPKNGKDINAKFI